MYVVNDVAVDVEVIVNAGVGCERVGVCVISSTVGVCDDIKRELRCIY